MNNENVPLEYELQNEDRVKIVISKLRETPPEDWVNKARTTRAKRKIREIKRR